MSDEVLQVRWLGRVRYRDALALQHALFRRGTGDHLLLLEHPHVYTLGVRARMEHVLDDPALVGAELVRADRGGDVTYHGPGQLVGYPVLSVRTAPGAVPAYVHAVEQVVIDALGEVGLPGAGRLPGSPGVWVDPDGAEPRKICAIGVRVSRGRSMHGFALNVDPDMGMFGHIVPCGIADRPVTSLAAEGVVVPMDEVVDAVVRAAASVLSATGAPRRVERQDASGPGSPAPTGKDAVACDEPGDAPPRTDVVGGAPGEGAGTVVLARPTRRARGLRSLERRMAAAGVEPGAGVSIGSRKPEWMRVEAHVGSDFLGLRRTMRELDLVTVCEEAGCPNIFECWASGTATFMINGERCTRACGFCLVDTRRPGPLDPDEPQRVAEAVARMRLAHAVVTAVARDDLDDGGARAFAATIEAIRARRPTTAVEVLVPDCKGDESALRTIFEARPDVLNHNLETVLRLQRAVRPSASYARSLSVLGRAKAAGLTVKSGLIVGMGETIGEMRGALRDLASVGVDIVTVGQYLRPTPAHLPVARWWSPEEFAELRADAYEMGFAHVQASPLTRSSYHAREALATATPVRLGRP
ncbi:MAG: lipoyl synthase [Actinomycetota bacterium]|nr:lipoyl synthase [Actinomycetota bacterium]